MTAARIWTTCLLFAAAVAPCCRAQPGATAQDLRTTTGRSSGQPLVEIGPQGAVFGAQPNSASVPWGDLVKWGVAVPMPPYTVVELRDGSRLAGTQQWTPRKPTVAVTEQVVELRWADGEDVRLPRAAVAAVRLGQGDPRSLVPTAAGSAATWKLDRVQLENGDELQGELQSLNSERAILLVDGEGTTIPLARIAAIELADPAAPEPPPAKSLLVGLAGGSLVVARAASANDVGARLVTAAGEVELRAHPGRLTMLQPLGMGIEYLSDVAPLEYRHTPYFDIDWPLARNEGFAGEPLVCGGHTYSKGIVMHTAARAVYAVPIGATTFSANLGVLDPTPKGGSAVFRVYVVRVGAPEQVYESPVIRGGDQPVAVDCKVEGARGLVLTVDYADRGDLQDHAVWLDPIVR